MESGIALEQPPAQRVQVEARGARMTNDGDASVFETPALLRIIWADPQNMPEHIALWSLKYFGPRAGNAVERLRREPPDARREEVEPLVIAHQTRVAMTEGAFVGGPFLVLIPVAFCAA